MNPNRFKLMLGAAVVLVALFVWNWISGWGLVTVHAYSQPLAKVVSSIERQGGIRIVTNAPTDAVVSMDVERVPAVEAVDMLAARMDGNWSIGYVAGPTKVDVSAAIDSLAAGGRNNDFRSFRSRGGGFDGMADIPIDSRLVAWKVSPSENMQLQSYLDQLSQKTGLMVMVPQAWNPDLPKPPSDAKAGSALRAMVGAVKGKSEEVFVIRVSNFNPTAGQTDNAPRTDGGFGGGQRDGNAGGGQRGGGGQSPPEWAEERALARIAVLPAAEREQAKKDYEEMRTTMEKMRALPEAERRTAMEQFFNNPVVQERMAERSAARDEKSGPERRADRSRRYIERKQEIKQQQEDAS
jgi:hypothetical protein